MLTPEHLDLAAKRVLTSEEKVRYAELKRDSYLVRMKQAENHAVIMAFLGGWCNCRGAFGSTGFVAFVGCGGDAFACGMGSI